MKTKRKPQARPVSQFEDLILRLEQIRREFFARIPDSEEIEQDTFENAINEAQTVIGLCMAQQLVDRCRRQKGGRVR